MYFSYVFHCAQANGARIINGMSLCSNDAHGCCRRRSLRDLALIRRPSIQSAVFVLTHDSSEPVWVNIELIRWQRRKLDRREWQRQRTRRLLTDSAFCAALALAAISAAALFAALE